VTYGYRATASAADRRINPRRARHTKVIRLVRWTRALKPAAATVLFSVMLVAAFSVHVKEGFFVTSGGYEYTLVLGVAALTFAFTGPGSLSVDALAGYSVSGALCGVAVLIVGVLGAVIPLIQRRTTDAINPTAG
jgi:hypothetical protein